MVRDRERSSPTLTTSDLIPDGALQEAGADKLEHNAVAKVIADLVTAVRASANIALFGPWGSGKSSLFALIKAQLDAKPDQHVAVVRYDAWKFAGPGLHRNFLSEVVRQLGLSDRDKAHIEGGVETSRLRLGTYLLRNWRSILGAVAIAALVGGAWALLRAGAQTDWDSWHAAWLALPDFVTAGGVTFGLVMAGLVLSNQSISSAIEKKTQSPLQDADQFFAAFEKMMGRLTRKRWLRSDREIRRLVVFVDELDRCSPGTVVDSLIQLMTYLGHEKCVFVVAADREVLEEALEKAPQAKPIRPNDPYYSTSGAFLDKVFQHQVELPPTRAEALTSYAMQLANEAGGLWAELREIGTRDYEDVVYALVPSHVRSPRRVKILMNDFATSARIMERRGLSWRHNAVQVAILTVLQTEFPSVARDFLVQPRLLDALAGDVTDPSEELEAAVGKFAPDSDVAEPAAPILNPESREDQSEANHRLNEQLRAYLARMRAAGAKMPTTDLVYVQTAAHADGLSDEGLSRLLDLAADIAPDELVAKFDSASDEDRTAAIRFLVAQLGTKFGPLRTNLVESASRIAFMLDADAARDVAPIASAPILGEVSSGRWRPGITPGAIWLGLLDAKGADPITMLEDSGELESLASSGVLDEFIPRMVSLGDSADRLFSFIGDAYADHPDIYCRAVRELSAAFAARIGESERAKVEDWLLLQAGEAVALAATPPADPEASSPAVSAAERYAEVLDAVTAQVRPELSPTLAAFVEYSSRSTLPLKAVVEERAPSIFDALAPTDRNRCILTVLESAESPAEIAEWAQWLDRTAPAASDLAAAVGVTCTKQLVTADDDAERSGLLPAIDSLLVWIDQAGGDQMAQISQAALIDAPPDGTTERETFRASIRQMLSLLDQAFPEARYEARSLLASLSEAVKSGAVSEVACPELVAETRLLPSEAAATLDTVAASESAVGNDQASVIRIRIAARQAAGLPPLKATDVINVSPSGSVTTEWVDTNPSISEFLRFMTKFKPSAATLAKYAARRNVTERSRMWIQSEKAGWEDDRLSAIGRRGVNESVVAHMTTRIDGAKLADQTTAVQRLISANLGASTEVRSATNDLILAILRTKVAGGGSNAAKLAIASRGAAPGRTDEIRTAFDDYFASIGKNQVPKGELRALSGMNLLTPRKKSPIASILGWLN